MKLSCIGAILAGGLPVGIGAVSVKETVASGASQPQQVVPELRPKSSEVFYRGDFPYDRNPKPIPGDWLPSVQDSKAYDADFVKDENDDDGAWKKQVEYYTKYKKLEDARKEEEESEARVRKFAEKKQKEEDDAEAELERRTRLYDEANKKYEKVKNSMTEETKEVQVQNDNFGKILAKVRALKKNVERAEEQAKGCQERVERAKQAMKDFKKELRANKGKVKEDKGGLDRAQKAYDAAKADKERAEQKLQQAEERLKEIMEKEEKAKVAEPETETTTTTKFSLIPGLKSGATPAATWRPAVALASALAAAAAACIM